MAQQIAMCGAGQYEAGRCSMGLDSLMRGQAVPSRPPTDWRQDHLIAVRFVLEIRAAGQVSENAVFPTSAETIVDVMSSVFR
jgi:hypothetical protein